MAPIHSRFESSTTDMWAWEERKEKAKKAKRMLKFLDGQEVTSNPSSPAESVGELSPIPSPTASEQDREIEGVVKDYLTQRVLACTAVTLARRERREIYDIAAEDDDANIVMQTILKQKLLEAQEACSHVNGTSEAGPSRQTPRYPPGLGLERREEEEEGLTQARTIIVTYPAGPASSSDNKEKEEPTDSEAETETGDYVPKEPEGKRSHDNEEAAETDSETVVASDTAGPSSPKDGEHARAKPQKSGPKSTKKKNLIKKKSQNRKKIIETRRKAKARQDRKKIKDDAKSEKDEEDEVADSSVTVCSASSCPIPTKRQTDETDSEYDTDYSFNIITGDELPESERRRRRRRDRTDDDDESVEPESQELSKSQRKKEKKKRKKNAVREAARLAQHTTAAEASYNPFTPLTSIQSEVKAKKPQMELEQEEPGQESSLFVSAVENSAPEDEQSISLTEKPSDRAQIHDDDQTVAEIGSEHETEQVAEETGLEEPVVSRLVADSNINVSTDNFEITVSPERPVVASVEEIEDDASPLGIGASVHIVQDAGNAIELSFEATAVDDSSGSTTVVNEPINTPLAGEPRPRPPSPPSPPPLPPRPTRSRTLYYAEGYPVVNPRAVWPNDTALHHLRARCGFHPACCYHRPRGFGMRPPGRSCCCMHHGGDCCQCHSMETESSGVVYQHFDGTVTLPYVPEHLRSRTPSPPPLPIVLERLEDPFAEEQSEAEFDERGFDSRIFSNMLARFGSIMNSPGPVTAMVRAWGDGLQRTMVLIDGQVPQYTEVPYPALPPESENEELDVPTVTGVICEPEAPGQAEQHTHEAIEAVAQEYHLQEEQEVAQQEENSQEEHSQQEEHPGEDPIVQVIWQVPLPGNLIGESEQISFEINPSSSRASTETVAESDVGNEKENTNEKDEKSDGQLKELKDNNEKPDEPHDGTDDQSDKQQKEEESNDNKPETRRPVFRPYVPGEVRSHSQPARKSKEMIFSRVSSFDSLAVEHTRLMVAPVFVQQACRNPERGRSWADEMDREASLTADAEAPSQGRGDEAGSENMPNNEQPSDDVQNADGAGVSGKGNGNGGEGGSNSAEGQEPYHFNEYQHIQWQDPRPVFHGPLLPHTPEYSSFLPPRDSSSPPHLHPPLSNIQTYYSDNLILARPLMPPLAIHVRKMYGDTSISDLEIVLHLDWAPMASIPHPVHKFMLQSNPTLHYIFTQLSIRAGAEVNEIHVHGGFLYRGMHAFGMALKHLYSWPLLTNNDLRVCTLQSMGIEQQPSEARPTVNPLYLDKAMVDYAFYYAATGAFLGYSDIVQRGMDIAFTLVSWDTIEQFLSFGVRINEYLIRCLDVAPVTATAAFDFEAQNKQLQRVWGERMTNYSLEYVLQAVDPDFPLWTKGRSEIVPDRIPIPIRTLPGSMMMSPELLNIRFGDLPAINEGKPSESFILIPCIALITLPYATLQRGLAILRKRKALTHGLLKKIVIEREDRRVRAIRFKNQSRPYPLDPIPTDQLNELGYREFVVSAPAQEDDTPQAVAERPGQLKREWKGLDPLNMDDLLPRASSNRPTVPTSDAN
ncbi:hypothetical protein N7474_010878 [Penicillium riverlandense]|uniref:uncharacterized protein n=1 Tax=Penicillium riverlandense TaxID=1903569 RepID=UPI002547792B|nr:uncharacterized protein N7474_010878 [Penicillium riverlandense]KAJ5804991.1 hypothetical protein N7474_010878 [Penicillium riverlandense]